MFWVGWVLQGKLSLLNRKEKHVASATGSPRAALSLGSNLGFGVVSCQRTIGVNVIIVLMRTASGTHVTWTPERPGPHKAMAGNRRVASSIPSDTPGQFDPPS